jgi:hypothetical protein
MPPVGSRWKKSRLLLFCFVLLIFATGGRLNADDAPAWIQDPTRTVDAGYLVYIGTSEDSLTDTARFKSEAAALEDLANECTFLPKGTRIEDHFQVAGANGFHAYSKVSLTLEECEQAQNTTDPDQIRALANTEMTETLKRYHDLIDNPTSLTPANAATDVELGDALSQTTYTPPQPWGTSAPHWKGTVVINSPWQYFVVRQQIAYWKTVVVLSSPGLYAPGTELRSGFEVGLQRVNAQRVSYEHVNPSVRSTSSAWSNVRANPGAPLAPAVIRRPAERSAERGAGPSEREVPAPRRAAPGAVPHPHTAPRNHVAHPTRRRPSSRAAKPIRRHPHKKKPPPR